MSLELHGFLARRRGAYEDAIAAYEEALGVVRDLGLREEVPFLLVPPGKPVVAVGRGANDRGDVEHSNGGEPA
jgi:hypothetical protein